MPEWGIKIKNYNIFEYPVGKDSIRKSSVVC